jgi:ribosomal protein S18 acetylase RimI-like enzyme
VSRRRAKRSHFSVYIRLNPFSILLKESDVATPDPAHKLHLSNFQTLGHPLDHVIWHALHTRHAGLSLGDGPARRYLPAVAPFAALDDMTPPSYQALAELLAPQERVALFTLEPPELPADFTVEYRNTLIQMIALEVPSPSGAIAIESLGAPHVDEMMALIDVAQPGPFAPRTHELGRYLGIRVDGRLAAMCGERMQLDGYTEISAVCAHPDYRGRGFPAELMKTLAQSILARGDVPFLHVLTENHSAIALYRKLGFVERRALHLTVSGLAIKES